MTDKKMRFGPDPNARLPEPEWAMPPLEEPTSEPFFKSANAKSGDAMSGPYRVVSHNGYQVFGPNNVHVATYMTHIGTEELRTALNAAYAAGLAASGREAEIRGMERARAMLIAACPTAECGHYDTCQAPCHTGAPPTKCIVATLQSEIDALANPKVTA